MIDVAVFFYPLVFTYIDKKRVKLRNCYKSGLNAGKVWQLLSDYAKWSYGALKRKSGLKDKELGAAIGWLAREDKIVLSQEEDELYISLGVNVYIG